MRRRAQAERAREAKALEPLLKPRGGVWWCGGVGCGVTGAGTYTDDGTEMHDMVARQVVAAAPKYYAQTSRTSEYEYAMPGPDPRHVHITTPHHITPHHTTPHHPSHVLQ